VLSLCSGERGNWNPLSWSSEGGPAISPACFSVSSFFISACLFLVPLYSWLSFFPFVSVIPLFSALSHLLWLYSQRMPSISTIENGFKAITAETVPVEGDEEGDD